MRLGSVRVRVGSTLGVGRAASCSLSSSNRLSGPGGSGRRMGARKARFDWVNPFLLEDFNLGFAGRRSVFAMVGSELGGAQDKRRSHDRALGGLFGQAGDSRIAGGRPRRKLMVMAK